MNLMEHKVKSFNIGDIEGIERKRIDYHLGLYKGYVDNLNSIYKTLEKTEDKQTIANIRRRISFELCGVVNHEKYFSQLEGGYKEIPSGKLKDLVEKQFSSFDNFIEEIKETAMSTRGIGWTMVYYDKDIDSLHIVWITDHELGAVSLPIVFALDMWEHSYVNNHRPEDKKEYVDAFMDAVNWEEVSRRVS